MADVYVEIVEPLILGVAANRIYKATTAEVSGTITVSKNGGAFGATAGTTATALTGGGLYMVLVPHATDINTEGPVVFKAAGATDNVYLLVHVKVGVTLAADAITAAKIADDAFAVEHFANDCLVAANFGDDCFVAANFGDDCFVAANFGADWLEAAGIADDAITALSAAELRYRMAT